MGNIGNRLEELQQSIQDAVGGIKPTMQKRQSILLPQLYQTDPAARKTHSIADPNEPIQLL